MIFVFYSVLVEQRGKFTIRTDVKVLGKGAFQILSHKHWTQLPLSRF